jgi:hypothetical protein
MNGALFQQKTFKYQSLTLDELRRKFATVAEQPVLVELLSATGCLPALTAPAGTH